MKHKLLLLTLYFIYIFCSIDNKIGTLKLYGINGSPVNKDFNQNNHIGDPQSFNLRSGDPQSKYSDNIVLKLENIEIELDNKYLSEDNGELKFSNTKTPLVFNYSKENKTPILETNDDRVLAVKDEKTLVLKKKEDINDGETGLSIIVSLSKPRASKPKVPRPEKQKEVDHHEADSTMEDMVISDTEEEDLPDVELKISPKEPGTNIYPLLERRRQNIKLVRTPDLRLAKYYLISKKYLGEAVKSIVRKLRNYEKIDEKNEKLKEDIISYFKDASKSNIEKIESLITDVLDTVLTEKKRKDRIFMDTIYRSERDEENKKKENSNVENNEDNDHEKDDSNNFEVNPNDSPNKEPAPEAGGDENVKPKNNLGGKFKNIFRRNKSKKASLAIK